MILLCFELLNGGVNDWFGFLQKRDLNAMPCSKEMAGS